MKEAHQLKLLVDLLSGGTALLDRADAVVDATRGHQ